MCDSNKTVDLSKIAMNKTNSYCDITTVYRLWRAPADFMYMHSQLITYLPLNYNIPSGECPIMHWIGKVWGMGIARG